MAIASSFYGSLAGAPRGPGPRRVGASPYVSRPPEEVYAARSRRQLFGPPPRRPAIPAPPAPSIPRYDAFQGDMGEQRFTEYGVTPDYALPPGMSPVISKPYYR